MKWRQFIIVRSAGFALIFAIAANILHGSANAAPTAAVIVPAPDETTERYAGLLTTELKGAFKILDGDMAATAFSAAEISTPFNLGIDDAKRAGAVIGCDVLIIIRTATLRRTTFDRPEYHESFAVIFLIETRGGRLVKWLVYPFEADSAKGAEELLFASVPGTAAEIAREMNTSQPKPANEIPHFPEPPAEDSPAAKNFRAPVPYKRLRPLITRDAAYYGIEATVDIVVDIDADGRILRTDIVRWAGFGLDESVDAAVRNMNWRPAERAGTALPMRVLLRYNFKNIPDTDPK